ncbi:interleukin-12 receptor subunit beta-1 [Ambystoma mexicanum]|uniref:interleukin-12 receptor subunit beta-1 n=1 Tax=Ambystoma mexicanum TaxID=8296 RepID=UPI0037E8AA33
MGCCHAGAMKRWTSLLLLVIFLREFQSSQEKDEVTKGTAKCRNGRTDDGMLQEYMKYCQEAESSSRVTDTWNRTDFDAGGPPTNVNCYLRPSDLVAVCTWKDHAVLTGTTYRLHYMKNDTRRVFTFSAGSSTRCTLGEDYIYMKAFITVWVEKCIRGCCHSSPNITLRLNDLVKHDPPAVKTFSKANGRFVMAWKRQKHRFLKEVRYKSEATLNWTEVPCKFTDEDPLQEFESCTLHFEKNFPFEVQARLKLQDKESLWSEWSTSVNVPAEIVRSPELNITVGNPGRSGHRKLDLQWKEPQREESNVMYTILAQMVPCPCKEVPQQIRGTRLSMNISEGDYNISIYASNAAGSGPVQSYIVEPNHQIGVPFLNVSLSGTNAVQVWWVVRRKRSSRYCIEWRPVSEDRSPGDCRLESLEAGTYSHKGPVQPKTCYRIAIYGFVKTPESWNTNGEGNIWRTLGSMYYYKPSNEDIPQDVAVTDIDVHSATIRWGEFLFNECRGVLHEYIVTIYLTQWNDTSKAQEATISGSVYKLTNLSAGAGYTVGIKGKTQLGEETGSRQIVFRTLKLDKSMAPWKLSVICIGILLAVFSTGGLCFFAVKRFKTIVCPEVPTPVNSLATRFSQDDMQQVSAQKALLSSSSSSAEAGVGDRLIIVRNAETEVFTAGDPREETRKPPMAICPQGKMESESGQSHHRPMSGIHMEEEALTTPYKRQQVVGGSRPGSVCEMDSDGDDLPFSYKRQMVLGPEEGPEQDEEELVEICNSVVHVKLDDTETETVHLFEDNGLPVTGWDPSNRPVKLKLITCSSNEQINLQNWGRLKLLVIDPN